MQTENHLENPVGKGFKLSIIIPMYNEEAALGLFFNALIPEIARVTYDYEIICINDGSTDRTLDILLKHNEANPRIKVVNLSRNFGKEKALTAGLDYCTGDAAIPIDADLQDPPHLIAQLVAKWQEGYDVVYGTRRARQGESATKKTTASFFYYFLNKLSEIPIPRNTGDFRLMDKRVIQALRLLPENGRFMKGLFSWVGFKQTMLLYDRHPRCSGTTKWNYWTLWNFALDGFTSFSCVPVRIWSYVGLFVSLAGMLFALFLILKYFIKGIDAPGYYSLMVVMLFLNGIILINLGILGEYIGRIFNEVKKRPIYLVNGLWGFESEQAPIVKDR